MITGIGFDFGSFTAQSQAIEKLKIWAAEEGYEVSPSVMEEIVGLSSNVPIAFVYENGHMYYGVDHGLILDTHDLLGTGVMGRLLDKADGSMELEVYSDYLPEQETTLVDSEVLPILRARYPELSEHWRGQNFIPAEDRQQAGDLLDY